MKSMLLLIRGMLNKYVILTSSFKKKILKSVCNKIIKPIKLGNEELFEIILPLDDEGITNELIRADIREKENVEFFLNYFKDKTNKIKTIVDIGSNLGYFVLLENIIFKDKTIYAIEPVTRNYTLLLKNINYCVKRNKIIPYNIAIGEKSGKLKIYTPKQGNWSSALNVVNTDKYEYVDSLSLREFLKMNKIQEYCLIRMDVEGYEYNIIKGAFTYLKKSKHVYMVMELHAHILKEKARELIELLENMNFKLIKVIISRSPIYYHFKNNVVRKFHNYLEYKLRQRIYDTFKKISSLEQLKKVLSKPDFRRGVHIYLYKE